MSEKECDKGFVIIATMKAPTLKCLVCGNEYPYGWFVGDENFKNWQRKFNKRPYCKKCKPSKVIKFYNTQLTAKDKEIAELKEKLEEQSYLSQLICEPQHKLERRILRTEADLWAAVEGLEKARKLLINIDEASSMNEYENRVNKVNSIVNQTLNKITPEVKDVDK